MNTGKSLTPRAANKAHGRSPLQFLALSLFFVLLTLHSPGAEELWSDSGCFIDLPEGFSLIGGDGQTRFAFTDPTGGMEFDLLIYDHARFADAESLAKERLSKLGSRGETEKFIYEGREAVFAELSFSLGGSPKRGYAVFIAARRTSGSGASGGSPGGTSGGSPGGDRAGSGDSASRASLPPEPHTVLLAYSDAAEYEKFTDIILSSLDSFSIDLAARRSPGPVSQYILAWPPEPGAGLKTVAFGEARLELPWNQAEADQCAETAGREFRVLQAYRETEDLWKLAWARCFRMIYRESARRLDRLAIEIDRLLPDDPTDASRTLLQWVQGFQYERDQEGIDFVDPLSAAFEGRGDCDSRALVMAIILERRGIDSLLMLSRDYSHAMAAVDVPGGGQRFPWAGKEWLVAETTTKVGFGMIAADQADWNKWIGVQFGD